MTIRRGEIWIANLDPTEGSEQAGVRPTIIFQNDTISRYTTTYCCQKPGFSALDRI